MKAAFNFVEGSVTAPQCFLASSVFCDIKRLGTGKGSNRKKKRDLALIVSEIPATAAGMFTTNQVCAAPVKLCLQHLRQASARAIVVNSGNANACTGRRGWRDAQESAKALAKALRLRPTDVLVASTGRIGVALPMANVKRGIRQAVQCLGNQPEDAAGAAEAIMTSDTRRKELAVEILLGGKRVRIGGICKGAGMIQPGMSATGRPPAAQMHATMLSFLTTDAAVEPKTLQHCLEQAVAQSFNRVTVDGDMSTNDTVLLLANGAAGNDLLTGRRPKELARFQTALNALTLELAKLIVRDGEGVSRFVTIRLRGAKTIKDADSAVRAVANSALVKTSWCGGDPNWGRILDALGYSPAAVVEEKVDVGYSRAGSQQVLFALKKGRPTRTAFAALCRIAAEKEFDLHIHLHLGQAEALLYAADLTEAYVDFNKGNVTDPAAMGG